MFYTEYPETSYVLVVKIIFCNDIYFSVTFADGDDPGMPGGHHGCEGHDVGVEAVHHQVIVLHGDVPQRRARPVRELQLDIQQTLLDSKYRTYYYYFLSFI